MTCEKNNFLKNPVDRFIWRIQLGKGIGSKKNDCQKKKLNDSIESESKKKKREEKASHHQHIFNKRNKFTKIYRDFYVLFFRQRSQKYSRSTWSYLRSDADEFVSFQIILIATCNCSSLHTLCSYIYSTQPIHLFQFHFHPDAVCITIVYSLNYRTYRAQLMFRRLTSVKSQLLRRQHAIHPFLPYIYFRLTALDSPLYKSWFSILVSAKMRFPMQSFDAHLWASYITFQL